MKNLKKALLSTAVLAGLASGQAFAGTEACFETFKGADNVLVNGNVNALYTKSACKDNAGVREATLAALANGAIAYELTGGTNGLDVDFEALDGTDTDLQIVYVPTTDIPPGTLIEFEITNATFKGNANQLHLVKDDDLAAAGITFGAVASSDGAFDGTSKIKFITKAGITIGAGTRLVFSKVSTAADVDAIVPASINVKNTECTTDTTKKSVTIAATKAVTDGGTGYSIDGAVSKEAHKLLDISAQFMTMVGSSTVKGQVNAESKNFDNDTITARTEFVYDTAANAGLILRKAELVHKAGLVNRAAVLDRAVTVNGSDKLELSFVETADAGASVQAGLYDTRDGVGALASQIDINGASAGSFLAFASSKPATAQVAYDADDAFTLTQSGVLENNNKATLVAANTFEAGAVYNELFFTVSQTDLTKIMNFNYDINVHSKLNFSDSELDHCEKTTNTHNVGVNGAVLKVPYTVAGTGNFVRITNEHSVEAEVTVDLFSETANGTTGNRSVTAVKLANVPAKSSVVYYVPDVVQAGVDQKNYAGSDGNTTNGANLRHTMTFTVTSPKNTVHGVSVQKLSTGSDRVMPVLDMNDWQE